MSKATARDVLTRETLHLDHGQRDQITAMEIDALALASSCDKASELAIADKLLTLHQGAERWVRVLVAKAALEAVNGLSVAA